MATYKVKAAGEEYTVSVEDQPTGGARVEIDGKSFEVSLVGVEGGDRAAVAVPIAAAPAAVSALAPAAAAPAAAPVGSGSVVAPIPGLIVSITVKVGDAVSVGQIVLKLEAMKMENDIAAPVAGTVKQIAVAEGANVGDGQLLMVIE